VVQLLEKTLIRVGNDEYARENHSFGLTTLQTGHAKVNGTSIRFEFRGKSHISHSVDLHDPRLARIVRACRDLPGHELFQYVDSDGQRQAVGSADVNQYVRDVTGQPFTSKDFRTWAGTVLVARALADFRATGNTRQTKRQVVRAVETAARRLGNTPAVCRKCYIHPTVLAAFMEGRCIRVAGRHSRSHASKDWFSADELAVIRLLEAKGLRRPRSARKSRKDERPRGVRRLP
jgi:DNA topoisomerase-1